MSQPAIYAMIKPTPEPKAQLGLVRNQNALGERYPLDRLHCTMLNLGFARDWSEEQLASLIAVFGEVQFEPFEVGFDEIDGTMLRGGAGASDAKAFHHALRRAALTCGVELPIHNFWLHLSLAYQGMGVPRRRIEPIFWRVESFQLILSDNGHELLGHWTLERRQYALAL